MWQGLVNLLLGVWIATAPLVPLGVPWVRLNNISTGILVALVSGSIPIRKAWLSWLGIAAGTWVLLSTFFRNFVTGEGYQISNVISGVMVFIAGSIALAVFRQGEMQDE